MKQQTAVEWLEQRINVYLKSKTNETLWKIKQNFVKAKQMEKEQRIKDYNVGYTDAQCNHINDAENYVNEQEYLNDDPEIKGWTIGPFGTPEKL